jgi:hypothetical protein
VCKHVLPPEARGAVGAGRCRLHSQVTRRPRDSTSVTQGWVLPGRGSWLANATHLSRCSRGGTTARTLEEADAPTEAEVKLTWDTLSSRDTSSRSMAPHMAPAEALSDVAKVEDGPHASTPPTLLVGRACSAVMTSGSASWAAATGGADPAEAAVAGPPGTAPTSDDAPPTPASTVSLPQGELPPPSTVPAAALQGAGASSIASGCTSLVIAAPVPSSPATPGCERDPTWLPLPQQASGVEMPTVLTGILLTRPAVASTAGATSADDAKPEGTAAQTSLCLASSPATADLLLSWPPASPPW